MKPQYEDGKQFFQGLEQFKYLRITLTHQNSIQKEIKSTLKSGIVCCHSLQEIRKS